MIERNDERQENQQAALMFFMERGCETIVSRKNDALCSLDALDLLI